MDAQEDINNEIKKIISQDAHEVLKSVIDSFDVDTHEEPIFEMCFKNSKFKCAKMIFEKGVSEARLNACVGTSYDLSRLTMDQVHFLIDICKISERVFSKDILKKYSLQFNKVEQKERNKTCIVL
jgi:hypothetical protein